MVKQILQLIIISTFLIAETDERDSIQVGGFS